MKRLAWIVSLVVVVSLFVSCGAPTSAKIEKIKSWEKKAASAYVDFFNSHKGKTFMELSDVEEPENFKQLENEKYPYDESSTLGDEVIVRPEFEDGHLVLYLKVEIGDEDRQLAQKITGNKDAETYFVQTKIHVKFDKDVKGYEDLMTAKIKKAWAEDPEVVASSY